MCRVPVGHALCQRVEIQAPSLGHCKDVPFGLCSIPCIHDIFDCQLVKALVLTENLDDIPTEAVDINPTANGPFGLGNVQEPAQCIIVEVLYRQIVLTEIDDCDLAWGGKRRRRSVTAVWFCRIYTRLSARVPAWTDLEALEVLNGPESAGALEPASWGRYRWVGQLSIIACHVTAGWVVRYDTSSLDISCWSRASTEVGRLLRRWARHW